MENTRILLICARKKIITLPKPGYPHELERIANILIPVDLDEPYMKLENKKSNRTIILPGNQNDVRFIDTRMATGEDLNYQVRIFQPKLCIFDIGDSGIDIHFPLVKSIKSLSKKTHVSMFNDVGFEGLELLVYKNLKRPKVFDSIVAGVEPGLGYRTLINASCQRSYVFSKRGYIGKSFRGGRALFDKQKYS